MIKKIEKLRTKWANNVSIKNPLPEYPRPQMKRDKWKNLNGLWNYKITEKNENVENVSFENQINSVEKKILVPFPLESSLSRVKHILKPQEKLWYNKKFKIPTQWNDTKILLHFGAVDWETKVWINGRKAGVHRGGYDPFYFDITDLINSNFDLENNLKISVWDGTEENLQQRGKQVLNPKGIYYTSISGIWQTVWLEAVPLAYIKNFRIIPDIDKSQIKINKINISLEENQLQDYGIDTIEFIILDSTEKILKLSEKYIPNKEILVPVKNSKLWSPNSPFLYDLIIKIKNKSGNIIDEVKSYFGMRKFHIGEDSSGFKRIFLNNSPVFNFGPLDQGYWPNGLYTAPTDEALKYDIEFTKKMGFNIIRKHVKIEPARWYYHCDKIGMIVWQDMPNGGRVDPKYLAILGLVFGMKISDKNNRHDKNSRKQFKKELKSMIDNLHNFPCIAMWIPFNEAWGQFESEKISEWIKKYDKTRLVDSASGWFDQKGKPGDFISKHIYFLKLKLPKEIKKIKKKKTERAFIISEFGGYGLQIKEHLWDPDNDFGYKKYKNTEDLSIAYCDLIKNQLKPLISKGLAGAVYTQTTDVETETKGLLTYDRKLLKMDENRITEVNKTIIGNSFSN